MRKHEAVVLMGHFYKAQSALANAAEELSTLENKDESISLEKSIADAIAPILQLFPELDPYDS